MPNLDEFLNKKPEEISVPVNLEKIDGSKPCAECDLETNESWWDPEKLFLFWTCPNGHKNQHRIG